MRRGYGPLMIALLLAGCPPPDYQAVDLQVDLLVDPDDDPFDTLGSMRICFATDAGSEFELFPRDPGTYLVANIPDGTYDLVLQGFDLDSELVKDGQAPTVVAHAELSGVEVTAGGTPGYETVPFRLCGDDCPADCAAPVTLPPGEATLGLRRLAEE